MPIGKFSIEIEKLLEKLLNITEGESLRISIQNATRYTLQCECLFSQLMPFGFWCAWTWPFSQFFPLDWREYFHLFSKPWNVYNAENKSNGPMINDNNFERHVLIASNAILLSFYNYIESYDKFVAHDLICVATFKFY